MAGPDRIHARRLARRVGPALLGLLLMAAPAAGESREAERAMLAAARPSVVRVRWRDARLTHLTSVRNAVVVSADGLLLMAGPPPSRRGTLTVTLHDGRELRAGFLAADTQTALSLLRVPTTGLRPLELRPEVEADPDPSEAPFPPRPLLMPELGLQVVLLTGDGAVARGAIRAHGRFGTVLDPDTRRRERSTGLLGAALAALDTDAGSPLLDRRGRIAGLVVGRRNSVAPERGEPPEAPVLRERPEPVEAVAVPAAVIRIVRPLLEKLGRVPRGSLGVATEQVGAPLRAHLGLAGGGQLVRQIERDGAAFRAGLQRLDVISAVNGVPIQPGTSLHDVLLPFRPRSRVRLDVIRAGRLLRLPVTLGDR
jgi:S1-C subfamily serine protease